MFLAKKSPRSYVVLYQKFLHKSFIITDPLPPKNNSSHTSLNGTKPVPGPRSTVFHAFKEAAPIHGCQCPFLKYSANVAIGQSLCDTSNPSDTPQPFIRSRFLFSYDRYWGELPFCQELCSRPVGGTIQSHIFQRS